MAGDFNKPTTTSAYSAYSSEITNNLESLAKWMDGTSDSNIPTDAKRFSSTNRRFEEYNGSSWGELLPMATSGQAYQIRAEYANSAAVCTGNAATSSSCTGNAATATLATNSTNLGGVASSNYTLNTDIRAVAYGGTGASSASAARTNLSVYAKSETYTKTEVDSDVATLNAAIATKANITSPTITTPTLTNPTVTTQSQSNDSTYAASTYFANRAHYYGSEIALLPYIQGSWSEAGNGSFAVPIYQRGNVVAVELYLDAAATTGVATMYTISSGVLATFCNNMGYTHYIRTNGTSNTITIASSSTMNIVCNSVPAGIRCQAKLFAKSLL